MNWKNLAGGVALTAFAFGLTQTAVAQVTTSGVRGTVATPEGSAVADATVVLTDTRNGATRSMTTDAGGGFDFRNLNPGGPFSVAISAPGYQPTRLDGVFANLGQTSDVNLTFTAGEASADLIVVSASAANTAKVAIGPSSVFDQQTLETAPAINRDIKDILRLDPRVHLDEGNVDSVQCAGANPRFNSLTVDGIGLNDGFGLNNNGYPTERMPFPYDALSNVSVELAPFGVEYGFFTGCNINAVTKTGGNEFHGRLFYDFTNQEMMGDTADGIRASVPDFDEKRYGFAVGGPIIPDRVFFHAAYEKFEGQNFFGRGAQGSGAPTEINGTTQAEIDEIASIARTVYGYEPGEALLAAPTQDEKYLVRLDWNITNNHRAAFTYNYSKGLNLTESDRASNIFEFSNHFYNRGAELKAYSGQIFSDWTDNFSTQIRVSYNDVDFTQASRAGTDFGEVQIFDGANTIYLGADDSRHSNDLDYTTLAIKATADWRLGDHTLTFGGERLVFDIFNLFAQRTEGLYQFNSIADFRAGLARQARYQNSRITNDPNDAAAQFSYGINTAYIQDVWQNADGLTVTAGLRYDWYTADDKPLYSASFEARNGFRNDETLDGKSLLQPRLAFNWESDYGVTLRGGVGLFSGGNPNVWVSNNYSNNGVTLVSADFFGSATNRLNLFTQTWVQDEGSTTGRPIWGVIGSQFNTVASGSVNSGANALDPDFEIPSTWKLNIGFTEDFDVPGLGDGYTLTGDLLYSQDKTAATISDATLRQIGVLPDGRPRYVQVDGSDPDCATAPASTACTKRTSNGDYILTNTDGGQSLVVSASLSKSYDFGLDWTFGYAYNDAEDVNPMTSSVAFSNYTGVSVSDPENPGAATTNYETPHNFILKVAYEKAFFGDNKSRVSLFGTAYQARPYSVTFATTDGALSGDQANNRHLLYIPLVNDPSVIYGTGFNLADFNAYISELGLERGTIAGRNSIEGTWSNKFDLRLEQEFPTGFGKGSAFLVIENIGNLLNDEWGSIRQADFPQRLALVNATYNATTNQYSYNSFTRRTPEPIVNTNFQSIWSARVGINYKF